MDYLPGQGHGYGAYAAVMTASESGRRSLPIPQTQDDGLNLYDELIMIEPGIPFQIHSGFEEIGFDPRTHTGILKKFQLLDFDAGLGRDILLGGQDPQTGFHYVAIHDLEIIIVQGTPTPFHFPNSDHSEQFWGEMHVIEEENGLSIIVIPQAPYVESYWDERK